MVEIIAKMSLAPSKNSLNTHHNNHNYYNSQELHSTIKQLTLQLEHSQELLNQVKQENETLKEMIALLKAQK